MWRMLTRALFHIEKMETQISFPRTLDKQWKTAQAVSTRCSDGTHRVLRRYAQGVSPLQTRMECSYQQPEGEISGTQCQVKKANRQKYTFYDSMHTNVLFMDTNTFCSKTIKAIKRKIQDNVTSEGAGREWVEGRIPNSQKLLSY